ncbi:MAG: phosphatidate cytidylyltransferase [Burkholderiales bacterium]|nr:phosphatidate cytidylyltransferase [Burkholderiales bacterium]
MTVQEKFYCVLGGVGALLVLASVITWLLWMRRGNTPLITNLAARMRAWWVMVGIFAAAYVLGRNATLVFFAFVSFFALREFLTLTPTRAGDHRALSIAFFILIPVQYWLIGTDWYSLFAIFIPVYGFLLLPSFSALIQDTDHFLERSAKIQWGVMVAIYCISHVPALLLLDIPNYKGQDALLMFFFLLIVQLSDVFQYIFGKLMGKTKVAPVVSPSKTVEGLAGGIISASLLGGALWWLTPFNPLQSAAMAFIIALMGFLGGLVLSAVKRSLGVKDWGTMIEGHGGMMDRVDSVSFAAPIFFHLTRYFFT